MVDRIEHVVLVVRHVGARFVRADRDAVVVRLAELSLQTDVVHGGVRVAVVGGQMNGEVVDRREGDDSVL